LTEISASKNPTFGERVLLSVKGKEIKGVITYAFRTGTGQDAYAAQDQGSKAKHPND
jgi:hypothetical protein